jgi:hypothetical protein
MFGRIVLVLLDLISAWRFDGFEDDCQGYGMTFSIVTTYRQPPKTLFQKIKQHIYTVFSKRFLEKCRFSEVTYNMTHH